MPDASAHSGFLPRRGREHIGRCHRRRGETGGEGGGIYVAPGSPTEGGGGTYILGEATRTEIWFVRKPDSIGRSYDGTTDGSMVSFGTPQFTDGTNTFELTEGTDFTAKKTFDSADAGDHTVTVEITLIGNAATEYKLKSGEEKFKIRGTINKAYPELTVSLSETTCTVGEKAPAAVVYQRQAGKCRGDILLYAVPNTRWGFGV